MKNLFIVFILIGFFSACSADQDISTGVINGSYTKMLTVGSFIYAIHDESLTTIDITEPGNPYQINIQDVGFTIENIYHHSGVLFIGAEEGLTIFSIGMDGIPIKKSQTTYFESEIVTSCDPVIAKGDFAYVTLSTESVQVSRCFRTVPINELRIYNISDISNPILLSITDLDKPKGLSIDGNYLFVCEANLGLSVIDVSDATAPIIIDVLRNFESYDVITKDGLMMIVCPQEIRQYDYTDINNITYLSGIVL